MDEQVLEAALQALLAGEADDLSEALVEALAGLGQNDDEEDDGEVGFEGASTFDDAGLMTRDRGLVLRLTDGSEFQVSIVRSR